ncbi:C40 family peptidase [Myroides sp. LJL119]
MKKAIVLFSGLILCCSSMYGKGTIHTSGGLLLDQFSDFYEQENNQDPQKTIVLNESKQVDLDLQNQLDALLEEFIDELNERKMEYSYVSSQVISSAFDFYGVRYRFGGTTSNGIDCSGLVINAFSDTAVDLPRSSWDMAKVGQKISKNQAQKGDLIFFKTRGSRISHVGIITEVLDDEIKFIHSSTSRGVIVSSTKENYYRSRFVQINRVLDVNI